MKLYINSIAHYLPEQVVTNEKKKQSDAETKIEILKKQLGSL